MQSPWGDFCQILGACLDIAVGSPSGSLAHWLGYLGQILRAFLERGNLLGTLLGVCVGKSLRKSFNVLGECFLNLMGFLGLLPLVGGIREFPETSEHLARTLRGRATAMYGGFPGNFRASFPETSGEVVPSLAWGISPAPLGSPLGGALPNPGGTLLRLFWAVLGKVLESDGYSLATSCGQRKATAFRKSLRSSALGKGGGSVIKRNLWGDLQSEWGA